MGKFFFDPIKIKSDKNKYKIIVTNSSPTIDPVVERLLEKTLGLWSFQNSDGQPNKRS
jgi:hypothetical protein